MITDELDLPETWRSRHLGEVSEVRYGLGQPPKQAEDGVPMIRATNVKRGRISEEGLIRIKRSAIPESRNPYLKATDVVVVRSGAYTGDVAMVTEKWAGSVAGYDLVVSPSKSIDSAFCAYALLSSSVQQHFKGQSNRAAQAHLNRQQLQTTPIPLPPLPEQKKIAHILSTVQRAIEAQERIIQTTTELKKALMHKLFTEGLRNEPQKQTEIGPVSESWEVTTVGDVTAVRGGKRLSKGDKLVEKDTGFPYIRVTDFSEYSIDVRGLLFLTEEAQRPISRYIINRDDVFISIAGSIGITGMIPPELNGANLTENAARLIADDASQLHPRFLMYWLASQHCQAEIKAQTVKNAQPKLALARIKSLKIPLPSLEEQVEIASAFDLAGRKTENARAKRDQLHDLFRTLLHELMTAKTRVHELDLPGLDA